MGERGCVFICSHRNLYILVFPKNGLWQEWKDFYETPGLTKGNLQIFKIHHYIRLFATKESLTLMNSIKLFMTGLFLEDIKFMNLNIKVLHYRLAVKNDHLIGMHIEK